MKATSKKDGPTAYSAVPDNILDSVLSAIGPEVLGSFNDQQLESVHKALQAEQERHAHLFQVRGTLPLGFFKIYFLFLTGKDRRKKEMIIGREHRTPVSLLVQAGFLAVLVLGALTTVLLMLMAVNNLVDADLLEMLWIRDALAYLNSLSG